VRASSTGFLNFIKMKKIINFFIVALLLLANTGSSAQKSNPYNQSGIDYMTSLRMISNDVKTRGVNDFNQSTLDYYSNLIPLRSQATTEMASTILRTVKSSNFNLTNFIDNTTLSANAKQSLKNVFKGTVGQSWQDYQLGLVSKADNIKNGNLQNGEKELLLSVIAITYNATPLQQTNSASAECIAFGEGGSGPIPCWVVGATVGAIIGWQICGVWCLLGGAVIGGVIGALC
jgi:hypothetical protein